jgi:molybdenum cofactor cytidylyltransferase
LGLSDIKFGVVILGGGRSSRMGQPKLLLSWGRISVVVSLVQQWRETGASQMSVVRAAPDLDLERACGDVPCIINPAPERGMFSSIRCAAQWPNWDPTLDHWVIALGDQPHLRDTTLRQLVELAREYPNDVCQPARGGRARHPVVLPKSAFHRLRTTTANDLKEFLSSTSEPRRTIEIDDPGLDVDIDTPEDYERAKKLAGLA